ncbi:hypothetical protein PpBr36_06877 [Pyricularia pennisetigena]|uniref:hypothetical protein n=1 Tax=Pyricularia pennisetigena TaxID=1578925 RepID=UPI001154BF9C|nr:hypothetical protein PpBr36_06877 [Pyricularia pennisetigena]TLS25800.1 hypothetical protein PpBr36_06877 [Pyricularia pennisetigena]
MATVATYQFLQLGIIQILDVVLGPIGEDHLVGLGRLLAASLAGGAALLLRPAPEQRRGAPHTAVQAAAVATRHAERQTGILTDDDVVAAVDEAAEVSGARPAVEADASEVGAGPATPVGGDVATNNIGARAAPRAGVELDVDGRGEADGEAEDGGDLVEQHLEDCD